MLFGMYVVPVGHAKKKNSKSTNIFYINIEWNEIKKKYNKIEIKGKKMDIFVVPTKYGNTLYQ